MRERLVIGEITIPDGVTGLTIYAVENSYAYNYALDNGFSVVATEATPEVFEIKSVSHEVVDGKIIFSITTNNGDANRIKVGFGTAPNKSIAVADKYTVNSDGNRVWTLKITASSIDTDFYFDLRDGTTNKYLKNFFVFNCNS